MLSRHSAFIDFEHRVVRNYSLSDDPVFQTLPHYFNCTIGRAVGLLEIR